MVGESNGSWREELLEDLADELTVGHVGPMTKEYVESGVPFLRNKNVDPLNIDWDDMRYISREFHEKLKKSALSPGDVVIVRTGKPGAAALIPETLPEANCSDLVIVRCGPELDRRFLVYYLNSAAKHHIDSHLVGAVQQHFNVGAARELRMKLPPLAEQKVIAHILGTLDDKIELNRRMNETLESMSRAIFKSWFVDFDPVRAKMDGRQPAGMDADTAVLFPDSFDESEIGKIPSGWNGRNIGDLAHIRHGFAFKGEFFRTEPTSDVLLTPGNFAIGGGFKADKFKYYEGPVPEDFILRDGDLLVTMTDLSKMGDTLGYPAIVPRTREVRFLHNQRLGKVELKANAGIGTAFLYQTFCLPAYRHHVLGSASGSTVKHTSPDRIKAFEVPVPDEEVATVFERATSSLQGRLVANVNESETLAALRDTLLPRLLSGEIRVADAERTVEEVV